MQTVNTRDFTREFPKYKEMVKNGERIVVLDGKVPIGDFVPHNENIKFPGWKRQIKRITLSKGKSFTKSLLENRQEER